MDGAARGLPGYTAGHAHAQWGVRRRAVPMPDPTPNPSRFRLDLDAWRPSLRALWMVLAAFVIGLVLFALVWSGDRDDDRFFRADGAPPTAAPVDYEPLPMPLPAGGRDASGLDPDERKPADEVAQQEEPRLIEPPQPVAEEPAPAPAPAPGALSQPRPIPGAMPAPRYPPRALRRGESGTVMVQAAIGPDGVPTSVSVAQTSGSRLLDRAAVDAVERWRFEPAMLDGRPTVGSVVVPIEFAPAGR